MGVVSRSVSCRCAVVLLLLSVAALGQGAKVHPPDFPASENPQSERDQVRQREAWFRRGRGGRRGVPAAALLHRAYQQKMKMRAARRAQLGAAASSVAPFSFNPQVWSPVGPAPSISDPQGFQSYGPVQGRVTAVAVDQNDATGNTVYIGAADGGVWKTTNAACGGVGSAGDAQACVTWIPLTDTQASLSQGAIAVQPNAGGNPPVILVGTGEPDNAGPPAQPDSYFGQGILRSTDGGASWTRIPGGNCNSGPCLESFAGMGFSQIAFSTLKKNVVVAAAAATFTLGLDNPSFFNPQFVKGLYFSSDAGASWFLASIFDGGTQICTASNPPNGCSATSVVFNPFANGGSGAFYAAVRFHGYYVSIDNGRTFHRMGNQPNPSALSATNCPAAVTGIPPTCPMVRGELAVRPGGAVNAYEMYTVFVNTNAQGNVVNEDVWRLTSDAGTWTSMDATGTPGNPNGTGGINACGGGGGGEPNFPGDQASGCGLGQGDFNLFISAVPNGNNTDLYVGAINIFKCATGVASGNKTCANAGSWLNLTHTYGCAPAASLAHVHPDQHAVDFSLTHPAFIYFGNDGGVYRSLNSFGLNTNSCASTNPFDNINPGLGSLSTVVSFSQNLANLNQFVAGLQDNGSPAVDLGDSVNFPATTYGFQFTDVNAGDGGFNAIDHNSAGGNTWYTANTDISIQKCTLGASCRVTDFTTLYDANSTSAAVLGDHGPFYTTYILDPQKTSSILIGDCRLLRGNSSGSTATALSLNFDQNNTNANLPCTGNENDVAGLAAGGPVDGSGNSKVIYVTTNGNAAPGPNPTFGGDVWVTQNGGTTWARTTDNGPGATSINPNGYVISDVALDPTDVNGTTAYVTIMGFNGAGNGGHVWRTTNGGASWTDVSGNLPDVPVSSVVVDPRAGENKVVYLGTDVGVFTTADATVASPVWFEFGPTNGEAGQLPNAPVMRLRAVDQGVGKQFLTAGLYGRGLWQISLASNVPTYALSVSDSPQTIYVSPASATFHATATAFNGYTSSVNVTCVAGVTPPPGTCTLPASVTPTGAGAAFTVTAKNATAGDFQFNVHGVGTDASTVTRDLPLVLHVIDFTIGANPAAISVQRSNIGQTTITVTGLGTMTDTVTLTCPSLPAGFTCTFGQNGFVPASSGTPVLLTIGAPATIPGTNPTVITVSATGSLPGAPTHSTTVSVTVLPGLGFVPAAPCRIADTRLTGAQLNPGEFGGPAVAGQTSREFVVSNDTTCLPTPLVGTPQAYSLNVTVVPHGSLGFLTVYPSANGSCGTAPVASNLNSFDGRVKAVAVIVPAGPDGGVCTFASNTTDVVIDVNGYFVSGTPAGALQFFPLTPCRVVDTRNAAGALGGPTMAGQTARTFPVLSSGCAATIPGTVAAYSMNFTAVPRTSSLGFLTTWPAGLGQPVVSTLNAPTGTVVANEAIVPAGTGAGGTNPGDINVFVSNTADVVIDINGYFAPPGTGGLSLFTLPPCRVLDTRKTIGLFSVPIDIDVVGSGCNAAASAQAFVVNATVLPSGSMGFLTLWPGPSSTKPPLASTLNAVDGKVASNLALVPTSTGSISAFPSSSTQLILDISGYFAP